MRCGRPDYACALIEVTAGTLLLELRPITSTHAPGQATCFGGGRESGETARACLRRELMEELGWRPSRIAPAVDLWVARRWIARFYHVRLDRALERLTVLPGRRAVVAPVTDLAGLLVSPWHRAVITAWVGGRRVVVLP